MSSSDDEANHIFYKDRPDWKDVVPIPSDEGPAYVVSIEYSEQFADVYDYIRGIICTGEHSPRVLALTCDAISLNAANYTVWQLRRDVLEALGVPKLIDEDGLDKEFEKEFSFCEKMIENNQKNYQVWHHQKALVTWAVGYDEVSKTMKVTDRECQNVILNRELQLTKRILSCDAKNYHAWQHRQWILSVFKDFSMEMEYINTLLIEDVRNNSAWNQRYFVFLNLQDFSLEALQKEVNETWNYIKFAVSNESPWSYLRGILRLSGEHRTVLEKDIAGRCKVLFSLSEKKSVPMMALYVEIAEDLLTNGEADENFRVEITNFLEFIIKVDPIRKKYWEYVKEKFLAETLQTTSVTS